MSEMAKHECPSKTKFNSILLFNRECCFVFFSLHMFSYASAQMWVKPTTRKIFKLPLSQKIWCLTLFIICTRKTWILSYSAVWPYSSVPATKLALIECLLFNDLRLECHYNIVQINFQFVKNIFVDR